MANNGPNVTSWHAYKFPDGSAEVVLVGGDFGPTTGSVKLNVQGGGMVAPQIKLWTRTAIVVSAPADSVVMRAHVNVLDERGKEKLQAHSPAGQTRNTDGAVPTFAITSTDDTLDHIIVSGTVLDDVADVFLYDSSVPNQIVAADFVLDGGELQVSFPASFTAPIKKLRLADVTGSDVLERIEAGGWVPAANGVITAAVPNEVDGNVIINLMGSGLGVDQGSVQLREVGGVLETAPVLSGGWSDTVVQVVAAPSTTYDLIVLTRADGEVASVDPSVPAEITTPDVSNGNLMELSVSYSAGNNRVLIATSEPFFGIGANPPFALEMVAGGDTYTLVEGPSSGNWTMVDSTHAYIQDGNAWGAVVMSLDFYSTGVQLVLLADWDGSVATS